MKTTISIEVEINAALQTALRFHMENICAGMDHEDAKGLKFAK